MKKILNLGTSYLNTYLVELKEGWALVDTGYPFDYKHFLRSAKKKNIELSSIRYVILTHVHADHAGFLKKILADTGAKLITLPAEKERLLSGVNNKNVYISQKSMILINRISASLPAFQTFEPLDATDALDAETQPLEEEGITFFVLHGHTDNDLCFKVDDKLFVGDLCMNGAGSTGHSPMWIEDNVKLVKSWEELLKKEGDTLYVGHGKPFPKTELAQFIEKQFKRKIVKLFKN